ncbi:vacuole effluxer atg22 like domain-containing protein [Hirsutella rhossiliensis]|uniref:Autophagy-related protein n=1 Tax=Hirsutella rhossiliensis TaxID=111463 RepID=A0A9P8MM53_9HYPO|nr:vacuole effluxer atg22 like domain-containing protein [Hirsutella rhossiliensis]KAH0957600.1 vacuole effluxer atg22 like domain-containing protein [Hirsutella rhossiliensis]
MRDDSPHRKPSEDEETTAAKRSAAPVVVTRPDNGQPPVADDAAAAPMGTRRALWAWLILCFSTGPTSGMVNSYVTASIQSAANAVGRIPGTDRPCARRGAIKCVVKLGGRDVDYLSYLLYLRAISRASEGVVSILAAGAADYSDYRKIMMMGSIYLFGALALPFAGLTDRSYSHLNALSTLYVIISTVSGVYTIIEASYIPIFMRSAGWVRPRARLQDELPPAESSPTGAWIKGSRVSVLGLLSSNVGALLALLIGVIITYSRGSYVKEGYHNFLLAVTIAGCITIVFAIAGQILLPNVPGAKRPAGKSIFLLPLRTWLKLLGSIRRYPNAFKLCIGWVLWNTGYSNFLSLLGALFLETTGIQRGSSVYTVYTFMMVLFACMGSLAWLFAFRYTRLHIKNWAYIFLSVNILCVFWGCLGINANIPIGYKHQAEFWVADFLFMSTSSALRSLNRVLYASLIPKGSEAAFFGLEITLDLATGWINPLVQGVIQNRTHNLRFPMIPNLLLMVIALGLYVWTDVSKGIQDAEAPLAIASTPRENDGA